MNKELKILFVLSNPNIGGAETFILSIIQELSKYNVNVDILNIWKDAQIKKGALENDLKYFELDSTCRHISLKNIYKIHKLIKANKYEVLMGFGIRVNLTLKLLNIITRKPLVIGLRGLDLWRKWYHCLPDRLTDFLVDYYIPNSNAIADLRKSREKTSDKKIHTIRNGIDTDYFNRDNIFSCNTKYILPQDKVIITTVGNFRIQKGHDFLIMVIKAYEDKLKNVQFVWAGDGPLKKSLEGEIAKNNLENKITFLGKIDNVRSLLFYSDAVAMPSREEGMPRCIMEAMSMSLPCVATNVGGTKELILQDKTGFMSEFGNIESFGDNLVKLVEDEKLRYEFGITARKYIVQNFDIKNTALEYIKLFEKLF